MRTDDWRWRARGVWVWVDERVEWIAVAAIPVLVLLATWIVVCWGR